MWSNVQRDGRPAEYRWRHVLNAAKFGSRPLLECRAVTLPRERVYLPENTKNIENHSKYNNSGRLPDS